MVCCCECGARLKSRELDGEIQVYNFDTGKWTVKCPDCGRIGFDKEDYLEDVGYQSDDYLSYLH